MNKHLIFFILLLAIVIKSCNASPLNFIFSRRLFSKEKNSKKTKNNNNHSNHSNPSNPKNSANSKKPNFLESNK